MRGYYLMIGGGEIAIDKRKELEETKYDIYDDKNQLALEYSCDRSIATWTTNRHLALANTSVRQTRRFPHRHNSCAWSY